MRQEHARQVAARLISGNDTGLLSMCMSAWREAVLVSRHELERENLNGLHQMAQDQIEEVRREHARHIAARLMSGNDSGMLQTAMQAWREAIVIQRHELEKESLSALHKEAQDQIEEVRREHARHIAARLLMGNDSGLLQTCMSAWREAILIQRHE